jgi:hypothetical protein
MIFFFAQSSFISWPALFVGDLVGLWGDLVGLCGDFVGLWGIKVPEEFDDVVMSVAAVDDVLKKNRFINKTNFFYIH